MVLLFSSWNIALIIFSEERIRPLVKLPIFETDYSAIDTVCQVNSLMSCSWFACLSTSNIWVILRGLLRLMFHSLELIWLLNVEHIFGYRHRLLPLVLIVWIEWRSLILNVDWVLWILVRESVILLYSQTWLLPSVRLKIQLGKVRSHGLDVLTCSLYVARHLLMVSYSTLISLMVKGTSCFLFFFTEEEIILAWLCLHFSVKLAKHDLILILEINGILGVVRRFPIILPWKGFSGMRESWMRRLLKRWRVISLVLLICLVLLITSITDTCPTIYFLILMSQAVGSLMAECRSRFLVKYLQV